ncbi:MAG: 4'-phosphopantetheinyl transferase superfamily protein [Lachnospiraceae bacterium]|nr:4'-phosphopantetheinyl transferase superfamily protein [Lachnospiraceae bacterium]
MNTLINRDPRKLIICLTDLRSEDTAALTESAAGRLLLVRALGDYLGRAPSAEELAGQSKSANGKPFFPAYPDFHYNISHSGDYVVCAYSAQPIGIDIQQIPDRARRASSIAGHFLSDREVAALQDLPDFEMRRLFTRFWTSRESYIKLTGRGLAEPFKSFYPDLSAGRIYSDNERSREIYITECKAPEGYCISTCSYMPIERIVWRCFPSEDIVFSS